MQRPGGRNIFVVLRNSEAAGVAGEQQKRGKRKSQRSEKEPGAGHCNVHETKSGGWVFLQ